MANGYAGRILHVDLTNERLWEENPPESFYRQYLGGSAVGMHYLLKEVKPGTDPLGPDNVLALTIGVPTGAPISGNSRLTATAKSPLTGGAGDAQAGGFFPAEMKFAGFDAVIVRGKASHPVYLWLHDGKAELRDASHLWGMTTSQTEDALKQELGDAKIEVAQVGPAGEKQARLACIINYANRANGRTGMGAVMGSKNLKAVVARGTSKKIPLADPKRLNELARWGAQQVQANASMRGLQRDGTAGVLAKQHANGTLPTRNWNESQFESFESISGELMTDTVLKERDTCYACATHCKRVVETSFNGRPVEPRHGGPEYETLGTFGSYCGVGDLGAVCYANKVCNEYGLDTVGTGATIAWAMECYTNGLLTEDEIGFPAPFGDAEAMARLVEMIAKREGIGDTLAEGSRRAADILGRGHEYLITSKGAESPAHMPHYKRSLGLIYAVNPFGADHQSSEHDPNIEVDTDDLEFNRLNLLGLNEKLPKRSLGPEKVRFAYQTQLFYSFLDSANLCQFDFGPAWTMFGPAETVEVIRAVTGWSDFDLDELLAVGERRLNMLRAFNAREGFTRADDALPRKFYKPLVGTGPTAGVAVTDAEMEPAKDTYYSLAGWDVQTGNPTREKLESLGLGWIDG